MLQDRRCSRHRSGRRALQDTGDDGRQYRDDGCDLRRARGAAGRACHQHQFGRRLCRRSAAARRRTQPSHRRPCMAPCISPARDAVRGRRHGAARDPAADACSTAPAIRITATDPTASAVSPIAASRSYCSARARSGATTFLSTTLPNWCFACCCAARPESSTSRPARCKLSRASPSRCAALSPQPVADQGLAAQWADAARRLSALRCAARRSALFRTSATRRWPTALRKAQREEFC